MNLLVFDCVNGLHEFERKNCDAVFNFRLMRICEHGLAERENTRMYTKKPKCIGHTGNFITASLVDTKPALLILLWGILLAIVLLFVELGVEKLHAKKKYTEE